MNQPINSKKTPLILIAQFASLFLIWVFVLSLSIWVIHLIDISLDLNDAPGASIAISIVAIPVFITLASVLTYVFIGLYREEKRLAEKSGGK